MSTAPEPIAVIGSGCRFPGGASTPSKLWDLLSSPRDVLREFPKDGLNLGAFHHTDGEHHGRTDVCNKSYLLEEDSRQFDAAFFNINPAEADGMDPQQRLALEVAYESMESAGYTLKQMQGSLTSVYLGVMTADYLHIQTRDPETINRYHATGTANSILSNRVSYVFDLRGPSLTLDTACSSSLAAVHLAVQSLRRGESKLAIALGANLIFDPAGYISESKLHMLSPTSRSSMWDASANGYARGEGVAAVLLKPLSEAIRDGDHIECIVRETGMNSDGRTPGITMPSAEAQATLIRRTYAAAGLDPVKDRPQFFECHGTGTLAGDPTEARAVHSAFFPPETGSATTNQQETETPKSKLYCGSIKTIIGHTEGCAGLAGLLKSSLALQAGVIPPNLLFKTLNPAIRPLYDCLEVPTSVIPWPEAPIRRVSLNSFGFGGTNVHAIIEAHIPQEPGPDASPMEIAQATTSTSADLDGRFVGPLTLSAESQASLLTTLKEFARLIEQDCEIDLNHLAWITQTRRNAFKFRTSFAGNKDTLLSSIVNAIAEKNPVGKRVLSSPPDADGFALLGIFTGQGAQWPAMGRELYRTSHAYAAAISRCEDALRDLPDAPSWSLSKELIAPEATSRVGEAAISQPLCTAIQIGLIDVLAAANVRFTAAVGHSSGEIAAAYAAGILSATDAMRIAYYRGYHAKLAQGHGGKRGAMMAVGLGYEQAIAFCKQPEFEGRIGLAASNAPTSTTLSGDEDAIQAAKELLDQQGTFARTLKVDTAYHSYHMLACSEPYLQSLRKCKIQVRPSNGCIWVSSVYGNAEILDFEEDMQALEGPYWVQNMEKSVLFSEAVECALWRAGPFDLAVEVGPHPALKGPASQTIKTALGSILPYAAVSKRGGDDVEEMSAGLGFIWSELESLVDFKGYRAAIYGPRASQPPMMKNLPAYAWDHGRIHWKESRPSAHYRRAESAPHELLGRLTGDSVTHSMRWRNVIRLNELPWLRGHAFQGQSLFPTSAYIAMAFQAAKEIANGRSISLIEIRDFTIPRGLALQEGHQGYESIFSVSQDVPISSDGLIFNGHFSCMTASNDASGPMETRCSGGLLIEFGSDEDGLPPVARARSGLTEVDIEEYYDSLLSIGLDYQGLFRGLTSVQRTFGYSKTAGKWNMSDVGPNYIMHPGPLDVAFHSIMASFSSPLSDGLWAPYLPVEIKRLALNPNVSYQANAGEINFDIHTCLTNSTQTSFEGDVFIQGTGQRTGLQMEGFLLRRVKDAKPSDDRTLYSKTVWSQDLLSSENDLTAIDPTEEDLALVQAIDRTSLHIIKTVFDHLTDEDTEGWKSFHKSFYSAAKYFLQLIRDSKMPGINPKWLLEDSTALVAGYKERYAGQADIELLSVVGDHLVDVLTSDTQLLEVMLQDGRWSNLYLEGRVFKPLNNAIGELVANISHRYPAANILEIGAGTGGTTNFILDKVGKAYGRYTFTDVSAGFFGNAKEKFASHGNRMTYKVLNVEKDPLEQGFTEHSYDLIIAAAVLHATPNLQQTLTHARSLLKPGGWLIMSEYTCEDLEMLLIMGGLEGWWLGADDGRTRGPGVSLEAWDQLLLDTGFSGVDKHVSDLPDPEKHSFSIIVSQAIDTRVSKIREPLSFLDEMPLEEHLLIIGGTNLSVARVVKGIEKLASRFADEVTTVKTIDAIREDQVPANTSVICLAELELSTFAEPISPQRLERLQWLFGRGQNVLWVTSGRLGENPYANLSVGLGRAIINELPQLNIQYLDVDKSDNAFDAGAVMEAFLRLKLGNATEIGREPLLYSVESEVVLRDGYTLLPRQKLDPVRNDRINSLRRTVTKEASLADSTVELVYAGPTLSMEVTTPWLTNDATKDPGDVSISVHQSISLPASGENPKFLCFGEMLKSGKKALAVSDSNASRIQANGPLLELQEDVSVSSDGLRATAAYLAAYHLKSRIEPHATSDATMLIYDCAADVARALASVCNGTRLFFASSTGSAKDPLQVKLHSRYTAHVMKQLLPADVALVISLSNNIADRVQEQLRTIYPLVHLSASQEVHSALLKTAYTAAAAAEDTFSGPTSLVQDVQSLKRDAALYPTVVDWSERESSVKTIVKPLRPSGLLRSDRTYVMVGLVSELGKSICRWMAENGARHIVLTSRNATVDEHWNSEITSLGATVYVYKMDVSDPDSVRSVHKSILTTLPPVGGVCNGALVLRDCLFVSMTADHLNDVLAPKVAGTVHLADVFCKPGLDFFISFSSTSSVQGNPGQCGYNAASLFQASFTQKLRNRGIPASVITLGIIPDVGYIAQRGRAFLEMLKPEFYHMISETDVHQIFAETIAASIPGTSDDDAEVISGVRPFMYDAATTRRPFWFSVPRLSHFVREEDAAISDTVGGSGDAVKVSLQVDAAGSEDEATNVISKAFAKKMESMLQMSPGTLNEEASLLDAGIDSLLAVEVRSWFLKELQVDVPVLKTLGGDSPKTICADVARKYLSARLRDGALKQEHEAGKASNSTAPSSDTAEDTSGPSAGDSARSDSSDSGADGPSTPQTSNEGSVYEAEKETSLQREVGRTEKLSFAQSRVWFAESLANDPTFYNTFVVYKIQGRIQIPRFRRAIAAVVAQHESLRSCFFPSPADGQPVQALLKEPIDCFQHITNASQERVDAEIEDLRHHQWDIANGEGLRLTLISLSENDHRLLLGYHHLVMDGVGMYIFLRELHGLYTGKEVPRPVSQFFDLTVAERKLFEEGGMGQKISFWREAFASPLDTLPLLPIASVKNRRAPEVYVNHEARLDLGPVLAKQLKNVGQALNVTPFYIHTAVVQLLLTRVLGLKDICIGATDANRNDTNRDVIGLFLNLLPLRFEIDDQEHFPQLVARTGQKYRKAQENAGVPFDMIVDNANIARDTTCTPLFQVAINYRQGNFFNIPMGNARMDCITTVEAKSPFDMVFCITPADDTCWVQVITRADIYDSAATQQILDMYANLLNEVVADKSKKLASYSLYDSPKIDAAIQIGRAQKEDFGWPATLSERVDSAIEKNPTGVALVDDTRSLSYTELQLSRDALALEIQKHFSGSVDGVSVAVFVQPSVNWPIGMLAVIRLGAVYVPLDCNLPDARLATILKVTGAQLIIHDDSTATRLQALSQIISGVTSLNIDKDVDFSPAAPVHVPNKERPGERTFILCTSGSTGVPKGIKLSQTGIINYVASKAKLLGLGKETVLQQSALGFDMSLAQAFQALARGGTLVVASQTARGDPLALSRLMVKTQVSFTVATPTEYQMLLRYGHEAIHSGSAWTHACSGGEAVSEDLKRAFQSLKNTPVFTDCYGPTEISCCATMKIVDLNSASSAKGSVGRANPNTSIYILDRDGHTLPIGMPGEIVIGGLGVALGYLDSKETAKAFISNPHKDAGCSKMYKTGDYGVLQEDGSLIFQGRMQGDTTVKVRGLRVDLEDVASAIRQSSDGLILDAVVTVRGDPAFLVAHVVVDPEFQPSKSDLNRLASSLSLPRYMKPSIIVPLPRLPMSTNGKVDRKAIAALPLPVEEIDQSGARQLTLVEGELKLLWKKVLTLHESAAPVTAESDFFEAGGTSLLLMKLQAGIRLSMGMEVGLHDLYNASTLTSMAALVSARKEHYRPPQIDWDVETRPPVDLDVATGKDPVDTKSQTGLEVLLTGSTGFLGDSILTALLADPAVAMIHCIAVDPETISCHRADARISLYGGSLAEPRLGLDDVTFTALFGQVHRIVLAGAQGHCLNNYVALRKPNVNSTRTLAAAALRRKIPIHYISSNRVTLLHPQAEAALPPISVADHEPRKDGSEGFTAAKWASEVVLEKFAANTALPVTIHRPCNVVGTEAPLEDALNALLRYCKLLRIVPAVGALDIRGFFDFRDVQAVADEIATAVVGGQGQGVAFKHYSSHVRVPPGEFRQYMQETTGTEMGEIPLGEWLQAARKAGMEDIIIAYLEAVVEKGQTLHYPFMGRSLEDGETL